MRERHVADSQIPKHAQDTNVVANHVPALNTYKRRDFSLRVRTADFLSGAAEGHVSRILDGVFVNRVNLIKRFLHGGRAHDAAINPYGKEDRVHAAFAHARNVHMAVGIAFAEVEVLGEKALRGVVVRIEHNRREMQFSSALRDVVGPRRRAKLRTREQNATKTQTRGEATAKSVQVALPGGNERNVPSKMSARL